MAREQLKNLTEPMYYILLSLKTPKTGSEIVFYVLEITKKRVELPPGTLYALLARFTDEDLIELEKTEDKSKRYIITEKGKKLLSEEKNRLELLIRDYNDYF